MIYQSLQIWKIVNRIFLKKKLRGLDLTKPGLHSAGLAQLPQRSGGKAFKRPTRGPRRSADAAAEGVRGDAGHPIK
jgi:hypothetical protein